MKEPISKRRKHFYSFGDFRLYVAERELFRGAEPVALPPKALDTLLVLVRNRGHVVDKDELMKALWPDTFVEEGNLLYQISQLRKALGERPDRGAYIETLARRGYRFVADVTESWEEEAAEPKLAVVGTRASRSAAYPRSTSRTRWYVAGALVVAALMAGAWLGLLGPATTTAELKIIPFTTYPGSETYPAFSPNGDHVAFAWTGQNGDNTDIYVKLIGTTEPLRLTTDPARDVAPAWSPDGRTIAFLRHEGGKQQVILVPALGGPERKLAEVNSPSSRPTWSPDGKWLITADQDSAADSYYLVLIGVTSGEERRLTDSRPGSYGDYGPAISPDGRRLAFTRADSMWVGYLFTVELSAELTPRGELAQLTWEPTNNHFPAWTPDGGELVFQMGEQSPRLWRIGIDTPGEAQLLPFVGEDGAQPAVARRGERLAYSRRSVDTNVWRLDLDALDVGSSPARKLISSTRTDWNAAYSPDGQRIAYQSNRATTDGEIWACDQDGSNPVQLTSMGPGRSTGTPRWSPDGAYLAFDSRTDGRSREVGKGDVWVIASTGGEARLLTAHEAADLVPSWSRDGKWVYFASDRSGEYQVWKQPVEGGDAVQVTRQGGFHAIESPDGKRLYYSRLGSPGLFQIPVAGSGETQILESRLAGWGAFAVAEQGIYFVPRFEEGSHPSIRFYRFADQSVVTLLELDSFWVTLTVSPNERFLLYNQLDRQDADLMLVENFR